MRNFPRDNQGYCYGCGNRRVLVDEGCDDCWPQQGAPERRMWDEQCAWCEKESERVVCVGIGTYVALCGYCARKADEEREAFANSEENQLRGGK